MKTKYILLTLVLFLTTLTLTAQTWDEIIKLSASNGASGDSFGYESVSIDGNKAIVGSGAKNSSTGSVYVFELSGGTWSETAILTASNGVAGDFFGRSISLSGDKILVGADGKNSSEGSAYVFELSGGTWSQTAILTASNGLADDRFGYAVSINGDKTIVGAFGKTSNTGSAYIFELSGSTWTETDILTASNGAANDRFGSSVSISGDRALIGAWGADSYKGSAYVFELSGSTWTEVILLASNGASVDNFGESVSISGDRILVGARGVNSATGSAYVFELSGGTWSETAILSASDATTGDYFGESVNINGNKAIVGAYAKNTNTGSAYIYELSGSSWTETAILTASDVATSGDFGRGVMISGNTAIMGAPRGNSKKGAAYIFQFTCPTTAPTGTAAQSFCGVGTVADLTATGTEITWYADATTTIALASTDALVDGAIYYATDTDGCESQTRFEVTVTINPTLDSTVSVAGNTITATTKTATYQWLDCDNANAVISGATDASYTPTTSGNFAVEVTENGCSATSACTALSFVGLDEKSLSNLTIFPNPTQKEVMLSLTEQVKLELKDINGKILFVDKNASGNYTIDLSIYTKGLYFVSVSNRKGSATYKLIKE